ncbi:MAG: response regulator transcription factor [Acidobacteria bacterium]|nr:response regulator transcription factor [Acidobacteriota bacterium]
MPVTALLVDDERLALDELAYLLQDFPDVEVVATASNGPEAVKRIDDLEPDLVFLDVQMPGMDGLSVIRKVRVSGGHQPYFVLATAFDQHAVEAFRLEALDYLLKPVDKERLAESISRAQRSLAERARTAPPEPPAPPPLPPGPKPPIERAKILVRAQGRHLVVDSQDIIYATIQDGTITVVTGAIEGVANYRTIEEMQSHLDPDTFWRVHRSYLVNLHRIKEVIPWFRSSYQLKMDDKRGSEIPVSRVQTKRLRTLFKL